MFDKLEGDTVHLIKMGKYDTEKVRVPLSTFRSSITSIGSKYKTINTILYGTLDLVTKGDAFNKIIEGEMYNNIEKAGGRRKTRKSRKSRKARKSRKVRKSRKARKSRRSSRR
jgi:hypothetical protein